MSNDNLFDIKCFRMHFDPKFPEFFSKSPSDKLRSIQNLFYHQKERINSKLRHIHFLASESCEYSGSKFEFLLSVGILLDESFEIQRKLISVSDWECYVTNLKNFFAEENLARIRNFAFQEFGNDTRIFFDLDGAEGKSTSIENKRKRLHSFLRKTGIAPSDLLIYHYYNYFVMKDQGVDFSQVYEEAAYSAFALIFEEADCYVLDQSPSGPRCLRYSKDIRGKLVGKKTKSGRYTGFSKPNRLVSIHRVHRLSTL